MEQHSTADDFSPQDIFQLSKAFVQHFTSYLVAVSHGQAVWWFDTHGSTSSSAGSAVNGTALCGLPGKSFTCVLPASSILVQCTS